MFITDKEDFELIAVLWGALAIISAVGMHSIKWLPISNKKGSGSMSFLGSINKRAGWIIMEIPILISVIGFYLIGTDHFTVSAIFISLFAMHYVNRALIYPYRIKVAGKQMPMSTVLSSMTFYILNGYMIGWYFGALNPYSVDWLYDPRFTIGLIIFLFGFYVNVSSDNILINLRKPGETGYKIPQGGFFRYVSCPNYFGEIVEWIGFAIMTWSIPGLVYAVWVGLPLLSQALSAHEWYREYFNENYPQNRKAVFPKLL